MAGSPEQVVQLYIALVELEPAIWRRVQVPSDLTLHRLHGVIQAIFDWQDCHLYQFEVDGCRYAPPEEAGETLGGDRLYSSANLRLNQLLQRGVEQFAYVYDLGDEWVHGLAIEQALTPEAGTEYPVLVDGARRAPPEDIGGPPGFEAFLEAVSDPNHPDRDEFLEWYGGNEFQPEVMDADAIEAKLQRIRRQLRKGPQKQRSSSSRSARQWR